MSMKKGWTYKKLGECSYVQNGFAFNSKLFNSSNVGTPLVRIRDIKRGFSKTYTTESCEKEYTIENGDILIGMDGDFNVCIWNGGFSYLNQRVCHVVPSNEILSRFLYYYLPFPLNKINEKTSYSTVKHLSSKQIYNIITPVPPLSEQQQIVDRLDSAFAKMDAVKANAEKQLNDAKALFQKELSKALTPKEGWERKKLGEVCASMADGPFGSNLKKEHYTESKEVRIIQLSNIGEDGWREDNTKYTTFEHLETIKRSEVKPGDIVIAKMMPAGRAILCPNHESGYVLSSDAVRATLKKDLDNNFILFSINSEYFRKQVYANVSGSGRVRTSLTKLKECFLYIPTLSEQQAIVTHLDTLSEKLKAVEEKQKAVMAECDAMKQALLREVF